MATYDSLTDQVKSDIQAYTNKAMRETLVLLGEVSKKVDAPTWYQFAVDNVDGPVASLDAGEVIPNTSGFGQAKDLTKEEWLALQTILRSLSSTINSNRSLVVKAIGVNA